MAGYNWTNGMSNNAVHAYEKGELPASKFAQWLRKERGVKGCSAADVKELLDSSSYHHTSKFYNSTEFFDMEDFDENYPADCDELDDDGIPRLEKFQMVVAFRSKARRAKAESDCGIGSYFLNYAFDTNELKEAYCKIG